MKGAKGLIRQPRQISLITLFFRHPVWHTAIITLFEIHTLLVVNWVVLQWPHLVCPFLPGVLLVHFLLIVTSADTRSLILWKKLRFEVFGVILKSIGLTEKQSGAVRKSRAKTAKTLKKIYNFHSEVIWSHFEVNRDHRIAIGGRSYEPCRDREDFPGIRRLG